MELSYMIGRACMTSNYSHFPNPPFEINNQTKFVEIKQFLEQLSKEYGLSYINIKVPQYGTYIDELTQISLNYKKSLAPASILATQLVNMEIIQNKSAFEEIIKQISTDIFSITNNFSFTTRLKMIDLTMLLEAGFKSFPNYSKFLSETTGLPFYKLYKSIFDVLCFLLSSEIYMKNSGMKKGIAASLKFFSDRDKEDKNIFNYEGEAHNPFENYADKDEKDAEVVNPELLEAGLTIIHHTHTTNVYIQNNFNGTSQEEVETKKNWNAFFKPCLTLMGSIFLTWALSADPIQDLNIAHTFKEIATQINLHTALEQSHIKVELKEKNIIKEIDSHHINNTSV